MKGGPGSLELQELVEQATVDAHDEEEQLGGLFCALEEELALPFETEILGQTVVVRKLLQRNRDIAVEVFRGDASLVISLLDLPLKGRRPKGGKWILAYRHWARFL